MIDIIIWLFKLPIKLDPPIGIYIYGCILLLLVAGIYVAYNLQHFSFDTFLAVTASRLFLIGLVIFSWPIILSIIYWAFLVAFIPVSAGYFALKRKLYKESLKEKMHEALG